MEYSDFVENAWELPRQAVIGGNSYRIYTDYRDVLDIFQFLNDGELPEHLRWRIGVALFYEREVPECHYREAAEYLAWFIRGGCREQPPGPRLLDWQQDAPVIVADVNKVAGTEIRALPYLHWWTFLSWFHAIGQGQLSTLVSIRDKLSRGQKLEPWEQEYCRRSPHRVELTDPAQEAEKERLNRLLE